MEKKRKVGGTHIGFVLSFVIFILFLIFLYIALEPQIQIGRNKQFLLDNLEFQFVFGNITTSNTIIMTISNNSEITQPGKTCLLLQNIRGPGENQIPQSYFPNKLKIINNSGQTFNYSEKGNDNLRIGKWPGGSLKSNGYLLKIYFSEDFQEDLGDDSGTGCATPEEYMVNSLVEEDQVFESKIFDLVDLYEADYDSLKTQLGIPEDTDFWFNFTFANGTSTWPPEKNIPSTSNIYVSETPVQYLDSGANTQLGFLLMKLW